MRAAAVLLGLSAFAVFEGLCRITGWGAESAATSDFAEFADKRPLFVRSDDSAEFQVADNRRLYFAKESFPAVKQANEFRIFVFGGSTVQGRPFSISTSFTTFLEIALRQINPSIKWEVINCGGISYASYRLLPIVKECLNYQPDLYIVCSGHNEFLECITYTDARHASGILADSYGRLNQLNSFHLLQNAFNFVTRKPPSTDTPNFLSNEVDAMLDHQGGLDAYHRSALHAEEIELGFESNLVRMIAIADAANVPLMFIAPPSNLRDCPPFKSEFSAATDATTQQKISEKLNQAFELISTDTTSAVRLLISATEDDPAFAISWYQLGRALIQQNRIEEAHAAFIRARNEDVCPLRMTSDLKTTLLNVASSYQIPLMDAEKLLSARSRNGIPGDAVLVDHVHPSFGSHQNIAMALIDMMEANNWIEIINSEWRIAATSDFENHVQSLENMYFLSGRRTLETLKLWTQGRGDGPPLSQQHK